MKSNDTNRIYTKAHASRVVVMAMPAIFAICFGYPQFSFAGEDCCNIIKIDQMRGLVKAQHKTTGQVKTFNVESKKLLSLLKPGMSYGPTSVGGLNMSIQALEPDWADDCCNFAPQIGNMLQR